MRNHSCLLKELKQNWYRRHRMSGFAVPLWKQNLDIALQSSGKGIAYNRPKIVRFVMPQMPLLLLKTPVVAARLHCKINIGQAGHPAVHPIKSIRLKRKTSHVSMEAVQSKPLRN